MLGAALAHAAYTAHVVGDAACRPHRPVRCSLRAKPRATPARTLATPKTIAATLPHGPAPMPGVSTPGSDMDFGCCLSLVEAELAALAGQTPQPSASPPRKRADGPRFVW